MLVERLNWTVEAAEKRMMKRMSAGHYRGLCPNGKVVTIKKEGDGWSLSLDGESKGKYPIKRTALKKANALLTLEECDSDRID